MEMENSKLLCSVENGIQTVVFNRPHKKNAIDWAMYSVLVSILERAKEDSNVRMVVFTGTGSFFSSGNEIGSTENTESKGPIDPVGDFGKFVEALIKFPKLLAAIVNGPAIGIAATMLPLLDIVYASEQAYFQTPFTRLGLSAEACSTYTFPKILGKSKAGDMLYMCYKMNAHEAKQFGLISDLYTPDRLNELWKYFGTVSSLSIEGILAIKRLVKKWDEQTLLKINMEEVEELRKRLVSPDLMERFLAFIRRKNKL